MNQPKCDKDLYAQFLIAAQANFTCTEFENVSPRIGMAHDAATRMLYRERLTPRKLWDFTKQYIDLNNGCLILDDSVLDKQRSEYIEPARWQYSGAHHGTVKGIGMVNLLWAGGHNAHIPVDFRIYDPDADGKTKNDHFKEMLSLAEQRGFNPDFILFDSWYATLENLKHIDNSGWKWITRLPHNRIVSEKAHEQKHLDQLNIPAAGLIVHLRGYGMIKIFKTVSEEKSVEYLATNNLILSASAMERIYGKRWKIEEYHQGLKQQCGIAKCQARGGRAQRNHIWCAVYAFLMLELHRLRHGVTWKEAKLSIARGAIREYLFAPTINLSFATA